MASPKVMIVDDSRSVLLVARAMLEQEGYEVVTNSGPLGSGAMMMSERPDVLILDVHMPGLQGDALLGPMRRNPRTRDVKVLLHSAEPIEQLRERTVSSGADGYVPKVPMLANLCDAIRRVLVP